MTYKPTLYVITGPTASGKSALAVRMALRLGTEVINADSRQVYTGIPVVTAMPSDEERAAVRHHLLDFLPLTEYYSAARLGGGMRRLHDVCGRLVPRYRRTADSA